MTERTDIPHQSNHLLEAVVEGMLKKKGLEIVGLHLARINVPVCDYFMICHGTSNTHVFAIAASIEDEVLLKTGLKPARKEGHRNGEWVLLDYYDVVVHVFQESVRRHFQLEDLWADAPSIHVKENL